MPLRRGAGRLGLEGVVSPAGPISGGEISSQHTLTCVAWWKKCPLEHGPFEDVLPIKYGDVPLLP